MTDMDRLADSLSSVGLEPLIEPLRPHRALHRAPHRAPQSADQLMWLVTMCLYRYYCQPLWYKFTYVCLNL